MKLRTQEQRGGDLVQLPIMPGLGKAALYNDRNRSSTSGALGMIYGSRIYSPFLSTCRGHRGQRGNEWLLLLHHSSPSLSICLLQRVSDKPPTTPGTMEAPSRGMLVQLQTVTFKLFSCLICNEQQKFQMDKLVVD